jgi:hypothetical protein
VAGDDLATEERRGGCSEVEEKGKWGRNGMGRAGAAGDRGNESVVERVTGSVMAFIAFRAL